MECLPRQGATLQLLGQQLAYVTSGLLSSIAFCGGICKTGQQMFRYSARHHLHQGGWHESNHNHRVGNLHLLVLPSENHNIQNTQFIATFTT